MPSAMAKPPTRPMCADAVMDLVYGTRPFGGVDFRHIDDAVFSARLPPEVDTV
jgi:hypothetical protein